MDSHSRPEVVLPASADAGFFLSAGSGSFRLELLPSQQIKKMLTDLQARISLKALIEKYLRGRDSDAGLLIDIVQDPSRQVPIRGVLDDIRQFNNTQFTQQELALIDELLYLYG